MKKRRRVTHARLCELLHYDPETGEFRWLKPVTRWIRPGDLAGTVDQGYRRITIKGRHYRAHHLAWFYMTGEWCPLVIDHRDGDPVKQPFGQLASRNQNTEQRQ